MTDCIGKRLQYIQSSLEQHARREKVQIIAVTKYQPIDVFQPLFQAGIQHVGESRVIEALRRKSEIPYPFTWHLIGSLQKNKVAKAVMGFDYIHSIDSFELLKAVSDAVPRAGGKERQKVFLQVNPVLEQTKHGFTIADLDSSNELIYRLKELPYIEICGLMAMAPQRGLHGEHMVREAFSKTAQLFATLKATVFNDYPYDFAHLSMGMSQDYKIALEYGADFLRIGSFLFDKDESQSDRQ